MRYLSGLAILLASAALADEAPQPGTTLFVTCDNGLRCVRPPCPSRDTVLLPSGQRLARTEPDLDALSDEDRAYVQSRDGLYYGTVVLEGVIENGGIVATHVVRDATAEEAAMCRP